MISVRTLRAAGLSDAQIVKIFEADQQERLANVREQNRIRQQNHRSRNAVTRDVRDSRDDIEKKESKKVRKSLSIASEWAPTEADRAYAQRHGWPTDRINREAVRFRDHYLANGKPWKKWDAVWRNWVTSPYQNTNGANGHANRTPRPFSREDRRERTARALSDLADYTEGGGEAGPGDVVGLPFAKPR